MSPKLEEETYLVKPDAGSSTVSCEAAVELSSLTSPEICECCGLRGRGRRTWSWLWESFVERRSTSLEVAMAVVVVGG